MQKSKCKPHFNSYVRQNLLQIVVPVKTQYMVWFIVIFFGMRASIFD